MNTTKVGIIGCGNIADQYLKNIPKYPGIDLVSCSDIIESRAKERSAEYKIAYSKSVSDMLSDPNIELVINLTIPKAHAEISIEALKHGKHIYSEKPFAINKDQGLKILEASNDSNLRAGCAPDTFLGGGMQTCRYLIDKGEIGVPIAASAFMVNHGHEHWHTNPEFYYQIGGGPMFDMGPYYLTALVNLLGPIKTVSGVTSTSFSERTISNGPKSGKSIKVEVPTHVTSLLEFMNGATGTIITSFDVWSSDLPRIEIYGTKGTLSMPDPNKFTGPVQIKKGREKTWKEIPLTHPEGARGIGVSEMASSMRSGRKSRIDAELGFHILDVMQSIHESANSGHHVTIESACIQPSAVPTGLLEGAF